MNNIRLILGLLVSFTSGSLTSSLYHQQQRNKEIRAFIECQLAWEKYYSLSNQTSSVVQPITTNQSLWQLVLQSSLNLVQSKAQDLITNSQQPFTSEQQKYLVYHYEVLPKCSKIKDWEKQMNHLAKK